MTSHSGMLWIRICTLENTCSLSSCSDDLACFLSLNEIIRTHLHTCPHPYTCPRPYACPRPCTCLPSLQVLSIICPRALHWYTSPTASCPLKGIALAVTHFSHTFPFSPFHCSILISIQTFCYSFPSKTRRNLDSMSSPTTTQFLCSPFQQDSLKELYTLIVSNSSLLFLPSHSISLHHSTKNAQGHQ